MFNQGRRQEGYHRSLVRLERLDERRMLAPMADIVFLFDETQSDSASNTNEWLRSIVDELDSTLRIASGIDVRYGLVGYGEPGRLAHSQIVDYDPTPPNKPVFGRLFSEGNHLADIQAAIDSLSTQGAWEEGWDAIDHAIAEYDFRTGAVPIFVLVQNDEGRVIANESLTRSGVLSALKSKNVILNTLTVGAATDFTSGPLAIEWAPLFDLSPYEITTGDFANRRILGVEADAADGAADREHNYHLINTTNGSIVTTKPATSSDTLQISFNGSNTGGDRNGRQWQEYSHR